MSPPAPSRRTPIVVVPSNESRVAARARRVLVVDDNVDGAALLGAILELWGHEVGVAHDGPGALRVAETFQPELALVDIGLPVMDGHELASRLVALLGDRAPRLVAVTGYGQVKDTQRSRAAGFSDHLIKPVPRDRLRRILQELPG